MLLFSWFFTPLKKWKGVGSLLLCSFFSLNLLFSNPEKKQSFYEIATTTVLAPVQSFLHIKQGYFRVYSENRELIQQNMLLKMENDIFKHSQLQNERLRKMLLFKEKEKGKLIAGEIIARNSRRNENTWVINLGTIDSIDVNMPVLTSKGIVGKVAKAFKNYSLVELLYSPSCKVSVLSQKSQSIGILSNYGESMLVARFPAYSDIQVGDTLFTSGVGGIFPKGLAVGFVHNKGLNVDEVVESVEVIPFQKSNRVEEVFVYQKKTSWIVDL